MRKFVNVGLLLAILATPGAALAQEKKPEQAPPAPKMICKSDLVVGSLVSRKKRCFSATDWRRISEAAQAGGREMQERNAGIPQGGS
ncbi:hypothetical protein [Sphingomonas sp.]|jgi:hypothetical protein|uniref:hypothetical protein n=1 Tax=Sphingomonas sp. TaxID=28214 RepID=UPI002ED7B450